MSSSRLGPKLAIDPQTVDRSHKNDAQCRCFVPHWHTAIYRQPGSRWRLRYWNDGWDIVTAKDLFRSLG